MSRYLPKEKEMVLDQDAVNILMDADRNIESKLREYYTIPELQENIKNL